jgi:predicted alpha/beta superfamily hydrolase
VDVYLPASYGVSRRFYPVIYAQDGQNLSDPAMAFAGTWELDAALQEVARAGREAIVVGVANGGARRVFEYGPFYDSTHEAGGGERYVRFLVDTLKPRIDARYRTRAERGSSLLLGSSMGGLISLYAFFSASRVFGGVAALSPSIWFGDRQLLDLVTDRPMPHGRIYLDAGTDEGEETLRDARALVRLLRERGYRAGGAQLGRGRALRYVEAEGGQHREPDWARRLPAALAFLLTR